MAQHRGRGVDRGRRRVVREGALTQHAERGRRQAGARHREALEGAGKTRGNPLRLAFGAREGVAVDRVRRAPTEARSSSYSLY